MSKPPIRFEPRKLEELILYMALKNEGNETFGRTKLNKLLFFADFTAYVRTGEPITGAVYKKREFGPCPQNFLATTKRLQKTKRAVERELTTGRYPQKRLIALADPDLDVFSGREVALVDEVVDRHWDESATDLSELAHQSTGWRLAEMGEEIPYHTAFIPDDPQPLSPAELKWARTNVRKLLE